MRLIDADALDAAFTDLRFNADGTLAHWGDRPDWCLHGREVEKLIHDAPTIDAVPVVRGKWIIHKPFDSGRHNCNECIECSVCGTWFGHDCYEISNFCPNCGAKMEES